MVSSTMSLDNNKKSQHKDTNNLASPSDSSNNNNNTSSGVTNANESFLPSNDKLSLLFPKCRPRNDANLNQGSSTSGAMSQSTNSSTATMKTTSMLSSSQSASNLNTASSALSQLTSYNTQSNNNIHNNNFINNNNNNNNNISKQVKLSPDHKNYQLSSATLHDSYAETNPFRIGNSNSSINNTNDIYSTNLSRYDRYNYYYNPTSTNSNSMMHPHHHHASGTFQSLHHESDNANFFADPDEIEHNPYLETIKTVATIPSSVLNTTPPATPPALTNTPTDMSPISTNRNMWDLSPIKTTTPTKIKNQSPSNALYNRGLKASYKKRITTSDDENSERHNYFYSKKSYFATSQLENDNSDFVESTDNFEKDETPDFYSKIKSSGKNKVKQSESCNALCSETKKKDDRKIVKSKSGSGIMGNINLLEFI
jgi:hypothetical protein